MLLLLLSMLTSISFAAGVEITKDSSAQFEIPAGEAPSTLSALRAIERVSPTGEFRRGGLRVSAERALGGSAASGGELPLARVCFTALVGADVLPLLTSPEEFDVRWALDLVVMVPRLLPFKLADFFVFCACLAARHRSHGAFFILFAHFV